MVAPGIAVALAAVAGVGGFTAGLSVGIARHLVRARMGFQKELHDIRGEQATWADELLDEVALARADGVDAKGDVAMLRVRLDGLEEKVETGLGEGDREAASVRERLAQLQEEINGVKTFVIETAQAAAQRQQAEAERAALLEQQRLLEQRQQMAQVRQQILEQLAVEMEAAAVDARPAPVAEVAPQLPDPQALFSLQQEFVARRRALEEEQYAGPAPQPPATGL